MVSEKQGYDENFGGCDYGQPPSFFDPYNNPKHRHPTIRAGIHKLPGRKQGEYLTHREADEAVKLIRKWKDQPFFIQVSHYAVHTPIQAIQEVADKYKFKEGMSETNRKYAAMVESIDDCMRDMLAELKKNGIDKNTLIIFTSDNGGLDRNGSPTENAPYEVEKDTAMREEFMYLFSFAGRLKFRRLKLRIFQYHPLIYFPRLWK